MRLKCDPGQPTRAMPVRDVQHQARLTRVQLPTFDLNLLRTLDALLRERSVTRAAERLHVTQQAMSGTLKRLRETFGDELLLQVGRRFEPTALGAALSEPVREVLLRISQVLDTTPNFDPEQSTRRFQIAMSDFSMLTILPLFMAELSRCAPNVTCDMESINYCSFDDLASGTLDFHIIAKNWTIYPDCFPEGIRSLPLFQDDFVCVVDAASPIGDVLTVGDYAASPHAIVRSGGALQNTIESAWAVNHLAPKVAATSRSFINLIAMVVGTPIIATVQRSLAAKFAEILPIRILECPIPLDTLVLNLNWHERNEHEPAYVFVRECFVSAASKLGLPVRDQS